MLLALRQSQLAGKVAFVGFDTSPALIEALRKGEIDALVAQDPRTMGRRAVTAAVHHLAGTPVEPVIDTGVAVESSCIVTDPHGSLPLPATRRATCDVAKDRVYS